MTSETAMMRVIEMAGAGGPEVLVPAQRDVPVANAGEVVVKVAYAGVNGPDLMQRRGLYPPPPGASDLLGLEIAGEVVALGPDAKRLKQGDLVCALTNGGGYAEYCAVLEDHCLPVPAQMALADAASLPEAYFTIWSNVFMGARLAAGETLLVHGGAGGLGSAAIQLGKAFGAKVVATDNPQQRLAFCTSLGADRVVDYIAEDFVDVVRKEFGGADVIVDIVGGSNIQKNIKTARHDGRMIQLAFALGAKVELDVMPLMLKRLHYTGSTLRSRSDAYKSEVASQLVERVWPLFAQRRLRAVVGRTLALEEAADAHRLMESAGHFGKIVLKT
ncbi:MAG: NAD(P)H-quinone oxidoreductase [Casimicrobiaceae bacterium]